MVGAILKATNSSFQKGMPFCRSIYVKKVMKLFAFIFEQPSYKYQNNYRLGKFFFAEKQTMFSCMIINFKLQTNAFGMIIIYNMVGQLYKQVRMTRKCNNIIKAA